MVELYESLYQCSSFAYPICLILFRDLSQTRISHLPTTGLDMLEHLVLKRVRSLKVFPSVWDIPSVTVAELTYPQHCCAFAHPEKKDPEVRDYICKIVDYRSL